MRIYISGPITGTRYAESRFLVGENEAKNRNAPKAVHEIINPFYLGMVMPKAKHEEYMKICLALLDNADAIYMLIGWEKSKGCKIEHQRAVERGIQIFYQG